MLKFPSIKIKVTLLATAMITLASSFAAQAGLRQYSADLTSSKWAVTSNSAIQCTLSHDIPHYGKANFTSSASKQLNMSFELDMIRLPDNYSLAEVRSVAPSWKPGYTDRTLTQANFYKQFNLGLEKKIAWTMLNELDQGMSPTFFYNDWYSATDKISVALSTAKFHPIYHNFLACIDGLLDYSFDDISYTVLSFKSGEKLTESSQKRLNKIARYLSVAPELKLVLIDGYSDSYSNLWANLKLSERRSNKIRQYFTDNGVDVNRIQATGYGEKRHIASNQTILGRQQNRRVVIRMENF